MLDKLRLRLTLLYLLVGLGLVAALSAVTYGLLQYYFISSTDQALKVKMGLQFISMNAPMPADLYQSISQSSLVLVGTQSPESTMVGPSGSGNDDFSRHRILEESELADIFVMPLSIQGTLVSSAARLTVPFAVDQTAFTQALKLGSDLRTITAPDGTPIRLLSYRIASQPDVAVIQVGRSLLPQRNVLAQLLRGLVMLGAGSVIFIGLGAWVLSGKTIQPAQQAFEKQQTFVANASHELRAPLTLVRAGIEVAGREAVNARQSRILGATLEDADYMKKLLDDLLLLSRLDAHSVNLEIEAIQFPDFLNKVADKMQTIASQTGLQLSAESGKFTLNADPNRLQQVLFILIENSIRHNQPGGWVKLTARETTEQVVIEVKDSGKGIPEEHLERVFERFYKVEDGSKSAQKGSGLGLSIARGLVESHHGKIKIESKPGQGTTVTIMLPLEQGSKQRTKPFLKE